MSLVVGLGSSLGVRAGAVRAALGRALGTRHADVVAFATVDRRGTEPGLVAVVAEHGAPLRCYSAAQLDAVDVPHPSGVVRRHVGTRSVAEAAALLAARDLGGGVLVVPKLRGEQVTVAVTELISPSDPLPLTISSACTACGACLLTCPEHALHPAPQRPLVISPRCSSCGECVEVCPTDAIILHNGLGGGPAQ
ncbi:MAG: cobalamin biosynthesis protein [Actinomycetota bacterium]|nr:cobalamin biosynthesis protein [Actinomycetota bacterium]